MVSPPNCITFLFSCLKSQYFDFYFESLFRVYLFYVVL